MGKLRILFALAIVLGFVGCGTKKTGGHDSDYTQAASYSSSAKEDVASSPGYAASYDLASYYGEEITPSQERDLLSKETIYFGFDRFDITRDQALVVLAYARKLKENPNLRLRIEGNTDERGSSEYNVGLGERRANSVAKIMALKGISRQQLAVVSYGKEKPVAFGSDEYSWQLNRRAELHFEDRG